MKKITEAELSNRVSSLREKLVLEAAVGKDLGNGFQSATIQAMGGEYPAVLDTESNTYIFLNRRKDGGSIVRTLAPYLRSKDGEISGTMKIGPLTTAAMGKAGIATEPATTPVAPPTPIAGTDLPPLAPEVNPTDQRLANKTQTTPAADPVNGKTPEQAMLDPRYKTDPAFKAEVDAAAAIGTAPAAKGEETFNKITGKWEPAQTSDELDAVKKNAGLPAGPAAPAAAPVATPVQSGGRPATDQEAAAAGYSYVINGTDEGYAMSNGFIKDGRADLAAWKAAGSPGKPKPADSAPPAGYGDSSHLLSGNQQKTLDKQLAQNKAEANGVNAAGQNVSIQNPNGSTTNPESGKRSDAPVAAPGNGAPPVAYAASREAFDKAIANSNIPQSAAKVSTPAAVPVDPNDGPTGQALARMGISKKDRLNQAFVDSRLGAGKYKAGSADSNLALLKTKPADDTIDVTKQIRKPPAPILPSPDIVNPGGKVQQAPAPILPSPDIVNPGGSRLNSNGTVNTSPLTKLQRDTMNANDKTVKPKNEAVTYADDQTLARIVSLSRR